MPASHSPRSEPTFGPSCEAPTLWDTPANGPSEVTPSDPAHAAGGAPAAAPFASLPWIGLAVAALVLALPVLAAPLPGQGRQAAAPPPDHALAATEPRLIEEDEIVAGRFALRLAGASSADDLWRRWTEMKQRRLGLLDDISAAVRPAGGPGAGYVLLVGAFRNAATAADACGTLRARFLSCEVVNRDGSSLQPQA